MTGWNARDEILCRAIVCVVVATSWCLISVTDGLAQLKLPRLISDHMVIQRSVPVRLWGWSSPAAAVEVSLAEEHATVMVDSSGAWHVELPPMQAGGPYSLTVRVGADSIEVRDILVGDVWVASGQSNMEWQVVYSKDADREIAQADDPEIRHFDIPRSWSWEEQDTLAGGVWEAADSTTVGMFSGVAYFFARALRKHVDVPIGLVNTTWGSSRIESWMSAESLGISAGPDSAKRFVEVANQGIRDNLTARIGSLPDTDLGTVDGKPSWAEVDLDDSDWTLLSVPGAWEAGGYWDMDGVGWYRKHVDLSDCDSEGSVILRLGLIRDEDVTFVNGVEVGRTSSADEPRLYEVSRDVLRQGDNLIAMRVVNNAGNAGPWGLATEFYLTCGTRRTSLAGEWLFKPGKVEVDLIRRPYKVPTLLYNQMVHPLHKFPIKGVIWYQGEANTRESDLLPYGTQFADMIRDWRAAWGLGPVPFLWVQLAIYQPPRAAPGRSKWARLRESQSRALSLPNTAQVVAIDIGDANSIHPTNKQDVGHRLALAARKIAYDENVEASGPVPERFLIEDGRIRIAFDHTADGLQIGRGAQMLEGFMIAGIDRKFVSAKAKIEGREVVAWSDSVTTPVAVRYAWADNPESANLYNSAGLPASPFRTDDW